MPNSINQIYFATARRRSTAGARTAHAL